MENEEPNLVVPRPFPHEPSDILDRSNSLDLTPERDTVKKSRLHRKKNKTSQEESREYVHSHDVASPPHLAHLSIPRLNSTTPLLNKLCTLKHDQEQSIPQPPPSSSCAATTSSIPTSAATTCRGPRAHKMVLLDDLEGVVNPRPLKEVNVPRSTTRYKDLVSVQISDESFQKLTFKPRRARKGNSSGKMKEPSVMDLMVPSLECEEADWNSSIVGTGLGLVSEPAVIDSEDIFTFHSLINSLQ